MAQINISIKRLLNFPKCITHVIKRAMSTEQDVILEQKDGKGIITLNRPKALNSLNLSMIRKIYPQLKTWERDPDVKLVIIKGSGDKAFCAGGDVRAIANGIKNEDSSIGNFFQEEYQLNYLIGSLQIPYVALIHGITMGGGVGVSVHGSFRVATEKTVIAMPEAAIGFFPDVGGSYFLPKLPGKLGMYLALTGFRLSGRDIVKVGMATHFISSHRLPDLEQDLLRVSNPTLARVDKVLQKFQDKCETDFHKEFELKYAKGKINSCFNANSIEEIFQKLEKDGSEWSKQTHELLKKLSPTSLKVSFKQLKEGEKLAHLGDCLQMEYRLSQRFIKDHDFYEGVRAVLIDKDNKPSWNPATLNEVSQSQVDSYFSKLPQDLDL